MLGREDLEYLGLTIDRPFYILDIVYLGNIRFVYLDEGDDPLIYNMDERTYNSFETYGKTLSQLIEHVIMHIHKV